MVTAHMDCRSRRVEIDTPAPRGHISCGIPAGRRDDGSRRAFFFVYYPFASLPIANHSIRGYHPLPSYDAV